MEDVTTLIKGRSLDGVFSNFGALNCVADLSSLAAAVSQHLIPGAPLLWVVMGRHAPWEWLWYLYRGELSKSFRRLNREGTAWRGRRILYPTPGELTAMRADQGVRLPDDVWALCKESGLRRLLVGVESGSDEMLKRIRKDIRIQQVYDTVRKMREHGIAGNFPFIVGFPDESDDSIRATLACARRAHTSR